MKKSYVTLSFLFLLLAANPCLASDTDSTTTVIQQELSAEDRELLEMLELLEILELLDNMEEVAALEDNQ